MKFALQQKNAPSGKSTQPAKYIKPAFNPSAGLMFLDVSLLLV